MSSEGIQGEHLHGACGSFLGMHVTDSNFSQRSDIEENSCG